MYTQGFGQPRMNSEERVLDMMAQLDEHSEKIPEGMYPDCEFKGDESFEEKLKELLKENVIE